jgi:hypothetical protein
LAFFGVATSLAAHSTQLLVGFSHEQQPRKSLTLIENFHSTAGSDQKKTRKSWRVSVALSAYAHEPAQQQNTPEKPKPKPNENQTLEKKNPCKLHNQ